MLAGRRSMRELAEHPHLVEFAHRGMAAFDELWSQMSPAERAEALAAGEAFEADVARPRLTRPGHSSPPSRLA